MIVSLLTAGSYWKPDSAKTKWSLSTNFRSAILRWSYCKTAGRKWSISAWKLLVRSAILRNGSPKRAEWRLLCIVYRFTLLTFQRKIHWKQILLPFLPLMRIQPVIHIESFSVSRTNTADRMQLTSQVLHRKIQVRSDLDDVHVHITIVKLNLRSM